PSVIGPNTGPPLLRLARTGRTEGLSACAAVTNQKCNRSGLAQLARESHSVGTTLSILRASLIVLPHPIARCYLAWPSSIPFSILSFASLRALLIHHRPRSHLCTK